MTNGLRRRDARDTFTGRIVVLARSHPGISLVILIAVAVLLYLALGRLWTGERGKATQTLDAAVKGLVDANADEVMACVSPYFSADGFDKQTLGEALGRVLRPGLIAQASLYVPQFNVEDGRATATVEVRSSHEGRRGAGSIHSEWRVVFERSGGRWVIRAVAPLRIARQDAISLRTLLGSSR